jgi:hypothetical protein
MITILFLAAEPIDAHRLQLGEEGRDIGQELQLGQFRDRFKLEQRYSVRALDLTRAMLDLKPRIVHFSGHSNDQGELCLEDQNGNHRAAKPEAVAALFKQFPDQISCVLLNACDSEAQARAIAPYVGYAIGMNKPILDTAALAFSQGFYQALANGKQVPEAFEFARTAIGLAGIDGQFIPVLIAGTGRPPLDIRSTAHLPVIVGINCSDDDFYAMTRDSFTAMSKYEFSLDSSSDRFSLDRNDFCLHHPHWVPADPTEWTQLLKQIRELMGHLNRRISVPKVYHFFLKAPTGLAIGLGACVGVRHEVVLEHYQPGLGDSNYLTVLDLSGGAHPTRGAEIVRLRVTGSFQYLSATGLQAAKDNVYASICFAPNDPAPAIRKLAERDGASFVEIKSTLPGNIPPGADWLGIARELNTVLLGITGGGACSELHLFPSVPMPLAFTIGMGLDTRSAVAIHQWHAEDSTYGEIFRLNQLGSLSGQ